MNRKTIKATLLTLISSIAFVSLAQAAEVRSQISPPSPEREFRGAWVASVFNIDWPSKKNLTTAQQQQELTRMLDRLAEMKFNAVFLQVRPSCDALYPSKLEPWSEYLTGTMGKAPEPFYDPLAFAITEAHKRGLELHAWLNPYRAYVSPTNSKERIIATNHISQTHPELVRRYGKHLWLDPSEKGVQDHVSAVIRDIVTRYDVDGIHFDDYFYPYHEQVDETTQSTDFPDTANWKKYVASGGKMSRSDWRRENVNVMVHRLYQEIKAEKPWVRFGISPFGIWKSGVPPQIKGFNSYEELYCDSRKWLAEGWVDYLAPQLYWSIEAPQQSFPVLLRWWSQQNVKHRQIWPGNSTSNVGKRWTSDEIINQIKATRNQHGATGNIMWNIKRIFNDDAGLAEAIVSEAYVQPAVVPPFPWLSNVPPPSPNVTLKAQGTKVQVSWTPGTEATAPARHRKTVVEAKNPMNEKPWQWVVQTRVRGTWSTEVLPMDKLSYETDAQPDVVAVSAVNRFGALSAPEVRSVK